MFELKQQPSHETNLRIQENAKRQEWPDVFRGLAIVAVVMVHCTGHLLSHFSVRDWQWYLFASLNRSLQFAVPSFLMVSAYLNGASILRSEKSRTWPTFFERRLWSIGIPYLIASIVGVYFAAHAGAVISIREFISELLLGRCYYHLYFVILLVQLYVFLPFLIRFFKRPARLTTVCSVLALCLGTIFFSNRWFEYVPGFHNFRLEFPTISLQSSIMWYLGPVGLGLWILSQRHRDISRIIPKNLPYIVAVSLAVYLPFAVTGLFRHVDTFISQTSEWLFTGASSLLIVKLASVLERSSLLTKLGKSSLAIYLIHPYVLIVSERCLPLLKEVPPLLALAAYVLLSLTVPCALSAVWFWMWNRAEKTSFRITFSQ